MIPLTDLGNSLRVARLKAKRSQRNLAQAAKMTQDQLSRLEHNQLDPRYSTIRRVLKELGYELVAVPSTTLPLIADLIAPDGDAPLIDLSSEDKSA